MVELLLIAVSGLSWETGSHVTLYQRSARERGFGFVAQQLTAKHRDVILSADTNLIGLCLYHSMSKLLILLI